MKFGITTLVIIIFLTTCKNKPDKVNGQVGQLFSVTDSLRKYSQADSLVLPYEEEDWAWNDPETGDSSKFIKKGVFFVGQLNNAHFAFTIASSDFNFYYLIDDKWQKEESPYLHVSSGGFKLKYVDINGDGLRDIFVCSKISDDTNDWANEVFLFDRKLNQFSYRSWTAENLEYDKETGLIRSRQEFCNCKLLFKIEGEDLALQKMVRYFEDKGQARMEYSHPEESTDVIDSKIIGTPDSVWTIFSTALWDTSREWKRKE